MSVYFVKGKGWRYDFTLKGQRYTNQWYSSKKEARQAEARNREEVLNPEIVSKTPQIQTGITFLELVNLRLDNVKAYNSERHYSEYVYMAKRWVKEWGEIDAKAITQTMVEKFLFKRLKVSAFTANKEIRYLKSTFNFGKKRALIEKNPLDGISFFPMEKKVKFIPSVDDINRIIAVADPDTQDYLWVIRETMGRMSETNRLEWKDVNLEGRIVILYTRKKKGGHLTPRKIPMTTKLYEVLSRMFSKRDESKPWVFWHEYINSKTGQRCFGQYKERKKIMRSLCKKAGVQYFRFHAIRHAGASLMESNNIPIGSIQRILGHENRSTTEIYLHSIGDSEKMAIDLYERARQNSHTDSHTNEKRVMTRLP
jgi:integrase